MDALEPQERLFPGRPEERSRSSKNRLQEELIKKEKNLPNRFGRTLVVSALFALAGLIALSPVRSWSASDHQSQITGERLDPIAAIVEKAIREGKIPGAVLLVGNQGKVVYRRAFGSRALLPKRIPMTSDTLFDIASLTKVVATTTAVMQLIEEGAVQLDAPVARYWTAFKANGKSGITVRQLLTHYSGLRPGLEPKHRWAGYRKAMEMIVAERPVAPPGARFIYSDINFAVLGELVHRISGKPLDVYCADRIFKPLRMADTGFRPSRAADGRIAPTGYRKGEILCGEVHDPLCHTMGGIAGHAGLFSTADDLSLFSQMLLNGGSLHGVRVLSPPTVEEMTTPQSPLGKGNFRGLGWDLDAPFSSNRDDLFPVGSYGHLGYTGTAIWIDPVTRTYIILLTNRVHPDGRGDVKELRTQIKKAIADALGSLSEEQVLARRPSLKNYYESMKRYTVQVDRK